MRDILTSDKVKKLTGMTALSVMLVFDIFFWVFRLIQGAPLAFLIIFGISVILEILLFVALFPGAVELDYFSAMWPYYIAYSLPAIIGLITGLGIHTGEFGAFYSFAVLHAAMFAVFFVLKYVHKIAVNNVLSVCTLAVTAVFFVSFIGLQLSVNPEADFSLRWPLRRDIVYELSDDGEYYKVAAVMPGVGGNVVIPSLYKGKPVTEIKSNALQGDKFVKKISVPDSVVSIGNTAFSDCKNLRSVYIAGNAKLGSAIIGASPKCTLVELASAEECEMNMSTFSSASPYLKIVVDRELVDGYRKMSSHINYARYFAPNIEKGEIYINFEDYDRYTDTKIVSAGTALTIDELIDDDSLKCDTLEGEKENLAYQSFYRKKTLHGWYKGGSLEDENCFEFYDLSQDSAVKKKELVFSESVSLFPRWLDIYEANFETKHSSVAKPDTILFTELSEIPLPTVQRTGYSFRYWKENSGLGEDSDVAVSTIKKGTTKNCLFYADWSYNAPSAVLASDKQQNTMTYSLGDAMTLSADASHKLETSELSYQWYKDGLSLDGKTESTLTIKNVVEAGYYSCRIVAVNPENRDTASVTRYIQAVILAQQVELVWDTPKEVYYSGESVLPKADIKGVQDRIDILHNIEYRNSSGYVINNDISAGYYDAVVTISDTNYRLPNDFSSYGYTIKPYEIAAKWDYQPGTEFVYNGRQQGPEPLHSELKGVKGEQIYVSTSQNTDAGQNLISTMFSSNPNYVITDPNITYNIVRAPVTLTANDNSGVYGSATSTLSYRVTSGTVYIRDYISVVMNMTNLNVGTHRISISASHKNYDITCVEGIYKISPAAITLKADNKVGVYGEPLKELTYSVTRGEIYYNDDMNIGLSMNGVNAGTHQIDITASNPNYTVTLVPGQYSINRASVTLRADDKTSVYGDPTKALTYSVVVGTVYNNDDLNVRLSVNGTSVGKHTISITASNSNYIITTLNGVYEITSPPVVAAGHVLSENDTSCAAVNIKRTDYEAEQNVRGGQSLC